MRKTCGVLFRLRDRGMRDGVGAGNSGGAGDSSPGAGGRTAGGSRAAGWGVGGRGDRAGPAGDRAGGTGRGPGGLGCRDHRRERDRGGAGNRALAGAGFDRAALARRTAGDGAGAGLPADSGRAGGVAASGPGAAEGQGDHGSVGLGDNSAKVEGVRSKARRLAERGWLVQETSGAFSVGRRPVVVPDAGSSA